MYKTKVFKPEEVEKIKALEAKEYEKARADNRSLKFDSATRYVGKLGEIAFAELYPQFTAHTKDFEVLKFDFVTPKGERLETKTPATKGDYEWQPYYIVGLDYDQYHDKNHDILVFCFYNMIQLKVSVLGWNYRHVFDSHPTKTFYEKGADVYNYDTPPKFSFTVRNEHGMYIWKGDVLLPMKELEEKYA